MKKLFLKITRYSQESTCGVFFQQKEVATQVFSCEYCKILRKPILKNICERLLLNVEKSICKLTSAIACLSLREAYSEPYQTSKMERFVEIVNG